jgi:3-oxoacyl-[acyl-carrier-protein] synthase II
LPEFRRNLLAGVAGIEWLEVRYMGRLLAGVCHFDPLRHQKKKEVRVGTRAGSISIWCAREAMADSGVAFEAFPKDRVGIYIGCTEHGNVETENEIYAISKFNYDTKFWSHYHNPRTVANNPAGEASLNLGVTGPAYTIGAACAAGNLGLIHAAQMLRLGEVDLAICGGVSESIHTFGIFAGFKSQGALATHDDPAKASRPFDRARNGIVVSEGGCLYTLERLDDALARGAASTPRSPATASTATRATTSCPIPSARPSACASRSPTPASAPRTSTSSTPTRRRRRSGTSRNARRSARSSARAAPTPTSTTRRASSATAWGRPARSSWPATCRRSTT